MAKQKRQSALLNPNSWKKQHWLIAGVVLLIVFAAPILLNTIPRDTKKIETAANQFTPPNDWTLKTSDITPPHLICLNGGACPEVTKKWVSDRRVTTTELVNILEKTKWQYNISPSCSTLDNPKDDNYSCGVDASTSKYIMQLYVTSSNNNTNIILSVREN